MPFELDTEKELEKHMKVSEVVRWSVNVDKHPCSQPSDCRCWFLSLRIFCKIAILCGIDCAF